MRGTTTNPPERGCRRVLQTGVREVNDHKMGEPRRRRIPRAFPQRRGPDRRTTPGASSSSRRGRGSQELADTRFAAQCRRRRCRRQVHRAVERVRVAARLAPRRRTSRHCWPKVRRRPYREPAIEVARATCIAPGVIPPHPDGRAAFAMRDRAGVTAFSSFHRPFPGRHRLSGPRAPGIAACIQAPPPDPFFKRHATRDDSTRAAEPANARARTARTTRVKWCQHCS